MTTTTEKKKITITMSERRPITIVADEWPCVAYGEDYSGEHDFQAFDGAWIRVRQHTDGRAIVYGYAGDWKGGGRPGRRDVSAGFLLDKSDDIARAVRRVQGILTECDMAGYCALGAAERCIADLPAEEI